MNIKTFFHNIENGKETEKSVLLGKGTVSFDEGQLNINDVFLYKNKEHGNYFISTAVKEYEKDGEKKQYNPVVFKKELAEKITDKFVIQYYENLNKSKSQDIEKENTEVKEHKI